MKETQTGSGSSTDLYVHTEDAFLKHQADFLSFMYVRTKSRFLQRYIPSVLMSYRGKYRALFDPIYKIPKDANPGNWKQ